MNIHIKATDIPPTTTVTRSSMLLDELDTRRSMISQGDTRRRGTNIRKRGLNEYYEVWVGNLPFGTPRKILEDYIQQLMMMFFADCRRKTPSVNCTMNADHYLKRKRYAVLSFTSAEDAMRTIKFSGILFLQHKLHIRCTPPKNNAEETLIADNWHDLLPDFYLEGDEASKWYDDMDELWDKYATAPISKFGQEFSEEVESIRSARPEEPTIYPSLSTLFNNALAERKGERKQRRQIDYCILDECSDDESLVESEEINDVLLETIEGMDDDSMVLDGIRSSDTLQMAIGLVGSEELDNPSNLPTTQIIPPFSINKSIWSEDISIINPTRGDGATRERKEPLVENGGTTSRVNSTAPSIGNTTLWFDIHQFEGWKPPTKMIGDDKQEKRLDLYDNDVENTQTGKGGSNNEGKPIGQQYSKPNLVIAREGMETIDDIIEMDHITKTGENMSIAVITVDSDSHPNPCRKKKLPQSILQQQLVRLRMELMIEAIGAASHIQRIKKVVYAVACGYLALLNHLIKMRIMGTFDYPREVLARSNQISQFFVPLNDGIFND